MFEYRGEDTISNIVASNTGKYFVTELDGTLVVHKGDDYCKV